MTSLYEPQGKYHMVLLFDFAKFRVILSCFLLVKWAQASSGVKAQTLLGFLPT
jgi:hypothetical protein